jgi:hypothetical protein
MALHAKAKAEAGYRFYALYDKISREDILAHAYAQCRSNKGAPGVDGQDFADIEAHGVERWLAELALALRRETYRPEPIRRVFIPKANGKLRPLGISSVRDRVCMSTAEVLSAIYEQDFLPCSFGGGPKLSDCCGRRITGTNGAAKKGCFLRGTDGSNPSPSSGESGANLTCLASRLAQRRIGAPNHEPVRSVSFAPAVSYRGRKQF